MFAIEIAYQRNWKYLWIETDSMLVTLTFKSSKLVPWHLQNRWDNCIHLISSMAFMVTHIYREDNRCADKLANIGLSSQSFTWWDQMPTQIGGDFTRNRLGLPYFRFCWSLRVWFYVPPPFGVLFLFINISILGACSFLSCKFHLFKKKKNQTENFIGAKTGNDIYYRGEKHY